MNIHQNARLTFARRFEMVHDVLERGLTLVATASRHGVSVPTVRKWSGRYVVQGRAGLLNRCSRPPRNPRVIVQAVAVATPRADQHGLKIHSRNSQPGRANLAQASGRADA